MMGTFFGTPTVLPADDPETGEDRAGARTASDTQMNGAGTGGGTFVEEIVKILQQCKVKSMLLLGSRTESIPLDEAGYQYYLYRFVVEVVLKLLENEEGGGGKGDERTYQIRVSFVPEDVLFAQFLFGEERMVVATTESWSTREEWKAKGGGGGAYVGFYLEEAMKSHPQTCRRLIDIFDGRYRAQRAEVGEEVWRVKVGKSSSERGVSITTRFWRVTTSDFEPFDFGDRSEAATFEMGESSLKVLKGYLQQQSPGR